MRTAPTRRLALLIAALAVLACSSAFAGSTKSSSYTDPFPDALGAGLDVSTITVSDAANGTITFRIDTPNAQRTTVQGTDNLQLFIDADRNRSTGTNGFEYRMSLFGGNLPPFILEHWNGSAWVDTHAASFSGSFSNGVIFTVNSTDLGGATAFDFGIVTVDGSTGDNSDLAPNGALDETYPFPGPPTQRTLTVTRAGSGRVTSKPSGIDCGSDCSATFDDETSVTLTAHPGKGRRFKGWSGDCAGSGRCTLSMTEDRAARATFVKRPPSRKHMRPGLPSKHQLLSSEQLTWFDSFTLTRLPSGASVTFGCCGKTEKVKANASGRAHSGLLSAGIVGHRRFRRGDVITISVSKSGYFPCTIRLTMLVLNYRAASHC